MDIFRRWLVSSGAERLARYSRGVLLVAIMVVGVWGCGVKLKDRVVVPEVPLSAQVTDSVSGVMVALDNVRDARPITTLVDVNGRGSEPASDVGVQVQGALVRALTRGGYRVDGGSAVVIRGEVREWIARVRTGMPGTVTSEAKVFLEVLDPGDRRLYSGQYEGAASLEEPSISELDIRNNLGLAMSEAIRQVLADKKLRQLLQSF